MSKQATHGAATRMDGAAAAGANDAPDSYAGLAAWIKRHLGIMFTGEQRHVFKERAQALCKELGYSPEQLLGKLQDGDRRAAQRVAEQLSTNYTFFRREPELFEYFAQKVLPNLPAGPIRMWSAAAASGDEAYSMAIECLEYFGPAAVNRVRILGTDISGRQVANAERGIFPSEQTGLLGDTRAARWFTRGERGQLRVGELPRQLCMFRRMNLTQTAWPFANRFHVIFLRNVLYYFDAATRHQVLESCYEAAEEGATLITSLTEPLIEIPTRWRPVRPAVFRRGPVR